jgi:peptidylprolyl isomerase
MKTLTLPLTLLAFAAAPLFAQTAPTAHAPVHHTATTPAVHTAPACAKLPEISAKVPALPEGTPCAKSLLTFVSHPQVTLEYTSPLVTKEVVDSLGLASSSFSLDYAEIKVGTGPLALPKKFYTMKYTGYLEDTGAKFDSSDDHPGTPFTFPIGAHKVIAGWDLGLQGMHIGGKRRLYIPWQLAYGDRGNPQGGIAARANLIFDVEIVAQDDTDPNVKPAPAPTPASAPSKPVDPAAAKPATPAPATTTPATSPAAPPPATSTTPAKPAATPPAATPKL